MKLLGIDFVPLNAPLKTHLETASAGAIFFLIIGLLPVGYFITIYFLFFSKYWIYFCIYLLWIWIIDRDVIEKGGRPNEWVRSWALFKYAHDYFPVRMKAVPGFNLDAKRNYVSCTFPHGVIPMGSLSAFFPNAHPESGVLYPNHFLHGVTLHSHFYLPLYREVLLAMGLCSVSSRSIEWLLSRPEGGHIVGLLGGGAAESFHCQPGQYRLVLKNRKGFIKLAIKHGAPVIPSFAFGQNDTFKQVVFSENSIFRRIQNWVKRVSGVAPILFYGRGFFQYNFGMIPLQKPITIVLGHPIEVKKNEKPTQEEIDQVHEVFVRNLTDLFEEYKYQFEENPESSHIVII